MKNNDQISLQILRNIIRVYNRALPEERDYGFNWYARAHSDAQSIAARHRSNVDASAAVLSAVSPSSPWGKNLQDADKLFAAFNEGKRDTQLPSVGTYGFKNVLKAQSAIVSGTGEGLFNPKTAPKTFAFYHLILNPERDDLVVIDRHALAIAINWHCEHEIPAVKVWQARVCARHYIHAAKLLGILPHQLQAVTWLTWRREAGLPDDRATFAGGKR